MVELNAEIIYGIVCIRFIGGDSLDLCCYKI